MTQKKEHEEPDDISSEEQDGEVTTQSEEPAPEESPTREQESEADYLPKRRVIRRKKSKREKEHPLAAAIRLTVESGRVDFGARTALKNSVAGTAKLFVFARNTPRSIRTPITKYAALSHAPVIEFDGTTLELGAVCGKPFTISVLAVYDAGVSPLLDLAHVSKK